MNSFSANSTSEATPGTADTGGGHALFAMGWTLSQATELGPDARVLLLIREADGVLRPQGRAPADWVPPEQVRAAASATAEHGRPALRVSGAGRMAVAVAVRSDGATIMAVAAVDLPAEDETQGAEALRRLQWGVAGVEAHLRRAPGTLPAPPAVDDAALRTLRVMVRALEARGFHDAARIGATELARALSADRVAIARKVRGGARLVGLSHAAEFRRASRGTDLILAAAEEALDQQEALIVPPEAGAAPLSRRQLEALSRESGAQSVVALPIGPVEAPWGAVVAEFNGAEDAARAVPLLDVAGDALAPLLEVKRRDDRWWITRTAEGGTHALGALLGPRALGWKLAALLMLALLIAGATVTAPARVTADAEVTSAGRVVVSSPFEGFLAERLVRAGDTVEAGQVLLRLDDRDLQLDLLRQQATRRQKEIERDAAVAVNDRGRLSVVTAEIAEVDAELALTRAQIEAGQMRAPYAAIVTQDNTEGKVGAPVGRGEELLALAPLDDRSLTLHVPDSGIDRVAPGQGGILRLSAMPERPLTFEVTHMTPLTAARDGVNTFRAEAELTGPVPADLGLGMEGVAKITTGRDLWVLTWARPFWEALRLRLWSLWP